MTWLILCNLVGPRLEKLMEEFRGSMESEPPLPGSYTPKRGDMCAAIFSADGQWYRAKIEKIDGSKITVFFIDYGNVSINLPVTQCFIIYCLLGIKALKCA